MEDVDVRYVCGAQGCVVKRVNTILYVDDGDVFCVVMMSQGIG